MHPRRGAGPRIFAALNLVWIGLLVFFPVARHYGVLGLETIPDPAAGVIHLAVPWAGVAGGVAISLVGVCRHASDWDPAWNYWHVFRPVLGGVFGTAGVLIVVLFLDSLTVNSANQDRGLSELDALSVALLAVVAFVVGYRESTVRELIKRVADAILGSGDGQAEEVSPADQATPAALAFGRVPVNQQRTLTVRVHNRTDAELPLGDARSNLLRFTVEGEPWATAVPAGGTRDIGVTFQPTGHEEFAGQLVVLLGADTMVVPLSGQGV